MPLAACLPVFLGRGEAVEDTYRKRVRHFDELGHIHLLTFSCYKRMGLLINDQWKRLLSESIDRATERHSFHLTAFIYMPEHVHLLVRPYSDESRISKLLYGIKRPLSFRIKRSLEAAGNPLIDQLTVQERPGKKSFRFWQEGPGYDRNIVSLKKAIIAADYIHHNPVRRNLCNSPDQWRWSSWGHYHRPDVPIDSALPRVHMPAI